MNHTSRFSLTNIAVYFMLGMLILSFALWGVGDMVQQSGNNNAVAKVGGEKITVAALQRNLSREIEAVRSSLGAQYSPEMIGQLQLPRRVLAKQINRMLVQMESNKLGFIPSDADVAARIRMIPAFQNGQGAFDKEQFREILRRSNMSEKDYTTQLRQDMASGLLMDIISQGAQVPDAAITTLFQALDERRTATLYTLNANSVTVDEPSAEQLEAFYKDHGDAYSLPEMRTASYVTVKMEDILKKATPSEEDLKAAYNERIEEFKLPEQRVVSQLLFGSEADAKKAQSLLASGKSFEQAAKEANAQGKKPLPLGAITKNKVPGDAAEAVFALQAGGVTEPVKSAFGWHIFQVSKIEAPKTLSLEEARPQLENDAKQHTAETAISKLGNQLEDALAGGSSLAEAAKEAGLEVHTAGPVDKDGKTAGGAAAKDLPALDRFMEIMFKTAEKSESAFTPSKGGVYYLLRVESVSPESLRPLAEVKAQVIDGWKKAQREKLLSEAAADISAKFSDEKNRADVIRAHKLSVSNSPSLKRDSEDKTLPAPLLKELFERAPGASTGMYPTTNGDFIIAVVKDVTPSNAKPSQEVQAQLRKGLESSQHNELVDQYLRYLREKYTVTVDEDVLQSMNPE